MSLAPSDSPTSPSTRQPANEDTTNLDDFKLSKQAERMIELIDTNNLNKKTGYGIEALTDNVKRYEHNLSGVRASPENKTAGLLGMVEKTVQEHVLSGLDADSPAAKANMEKVSGEVRVAAKAIYDDPIANPLHRVSGGFFDIDKAKEKLAFGRPTHSSVFSNSILSKNQLLILNAVSDMPEHLQQFAMQGAKQAAADAAKSQNYAGHKTASVTYVKHSIESNLRSYDTFNRVAGYQEIVGGQEQAFDRAMYDAKGARQFVAAKGDKTLASKKPAAQIGVKSQDSYTAMMVEGLNTETQNLHDAYGKPHTFDGDIELKHQALNMLDNVKAFTDYLDERRADDNRDRLEGREINQLHNQTKDLVDNVLELSKELPFRDLEVTREADRTKEDMNTKDPLFQRAEQETTYKEAQESTKTTVRSIPRSLAIRNP